MKFSLTSVATLLLAAGQTVTAIPSPLGLTGVQLQNPFGSSGLSASDKPIPGDSPLMLCDLEAPKLVEIFNVTLSPNPPLRGSELVIFAQGVVKEVIEEGAYIDVDVRYGFIKLLKQTFDLCEQTGNVDLECPIQEGPISLETTVKLPDEIPPGKYIVVARAFTNDDQPITCLSTTVEFPAFF